MRRAVARPVSRVGPLAAAPEIPDRLDGWLRPWRRVDPLAAPGRLNPSEAPPELPPGGEVWQAPDGTVYERSTARLDHDVDGVIVWRFEGPTGEAPALEVEALTGAKRREIRRPGGASIKRAALPGSRFGSRVFVARRRPKGETGRAVHICEGAVDALALVASGQAGEFDAVIAAHGAGALVDLAGRMTVTEGRIHMWAHGDEAGERAVRRASEILASRGARGTRHWGIGDVGDAVCDSGRFEVLPDVEIPTWEGQ